MQTLRKKNSPCKFKKEPTRFLGEGVSFKAKLIGILEVSEARGDQMCQAALADLKMAIRAAGEHKQRIAVQVSIDGLRLRDEKTGECLYHHAVHKISFIAQDRYDSRAFGYIFGSPDTGHRFFGIKTDKAANQVVMAMRDLFQVVFELKKKEMELAKQHIEQNTMKYHSGIFVEPAPDTKGAAGTESCVHRIRPIAETGAGSCSGGSGSGGGGADNNNKSLEKKVENRSGVIADLLDLQFELNSLQQGIHQMDKMTPENSRPASEDPFEADPFGDSFTNMKVKDSVQPILPPPPSSAKRCHLERQSTVPTPSSSTCSPATVISNKTPPPPNQTSLQWLENEKEQRFSDGEVSNLTIHMNDGEHKVDDSENGFSEAASSSSRTAVARKSSPQIDVFTELDPLGTGLSKPYIDKKDFFQHLKNPPKKVLKDLVITSLSETFPTNFDITESLDPLKVNNDKQNDLFEDGDFANFNNFEEPHDITIKSQSPQTITNNNNNNKSRSIHHQPLSVCLPPEDISSMTSKTRGENLIKSDRESNPESIASLIRLPSPKKYQPVRKRDIDGDLPLSCRAPSIDKPFPVDFTLSTDSPASPLRSCSSDANSHLSTSSTELEIVPEPPPRGSGSILINPPPLPPKKQGVRAANKPPPRPPHNNSHFHYDFIEREDSLSASPIRKEHCRKSPEMEIVEEKFDDNFTPISPKFQANRISHSNFEDSFSSSTMPPTTLSSLFKKSYSSSSEVNKKKPSLDITLSQLTSSNLTELATSLDITVAELTNLTLQQLTECLSKLSCKEPQKTPIEDGGGTKEFNQIKENQECETRQNVSSFVVSSNEPLFPVDFDHEIKQPSSEEDSKYDKYAVFRELLALEQIKGESVRKESIGEEIIINSFSRKESLSLDETTATTADIIECKIDLNIKSNDNDIVKSDDSKGIIRDSMNEIEQISKKVEYELDTIHNDSVEFEEEEKDPADESDEKYQSLENLQCEKNLSEMCENSGEAEDDDHETQAQEKKLDEKSSPPPSSSASSVALNDRYAALREIVADMGSINECEEKPKSPLSPENASKGSLAEQDLLKLFSAPSSQRTSPTKTINKDQEPDLKTAASDIFEEIQMLNNSVKTIKLTPTPGFEDVFSPFTEHKTNQHDEEDHSKDESNWAKFETGVFNVDKSSYERKGSLGGTSPWSPEDREIQKELSFKSSAQRNSGESDNEWKDEEESEESNGRIRDDGLWARHSRFDSSGGGGGEEGTLYDAGDKDRHFRDRSMRKTRGGGGGGVLWTKTPHRPRIDSSPWHEETRWEGEHRRYPSRKISYKDEEERKAHWKCRTGQRQPPPLPWNGERDSSFRGSHEHQFYEEDRGKRRMTHWSEEDRDRDRDRDRFSSQESMGGYDDEERWSIREYERRKWEEEGRFWRGRSSGESDYPTVYRVKPNIHYCRDSPRNRPPIDYPPGWDEEYSLDRSETSPRAYVTRKRHWPKRPNSANEDRNTEVVYTEPRMKYGISRSECSDNDSDMYHHRPYRSRSRESYWESDQEFESWGERLYWSEGPDMKSESLHRRRMNRHKQISRPKPPQSSPFEDDFMQSIEQEHMETAAAVIAENRIRTDTADTKIPLSPQNISEHARKDLLRKHARSSYFEEAEFPPPPPAAAVATSDTSFSDRQRLGTNLKVIPPDEHPLDDHPKDPASIDSFISDDISGSKDSFFNGDPRFDDDAFVFRSEMADSVSNTSTLPLKNPRQIKYSNNKMKGDHNIKKSESVNIFVRESDPFDDDDFFN